MKAISAILLLIGIIAAPGYYFYCTSFSGSPLDRVTVFSQDVNSLSIGGMTVQSSGANAQWNTPVSFELTPEMNPISVKAIIRYMKPASVVKKRTGYRIDLAKDEKTVWEKTFLVSAKKEKKDGKSVPMIGSLPKTTIPITIFSIEESGLYLLDIHGTDERGLAVASLDVELRQNAILPNMKVVISGGIALLLGMAGLIISGKRRSHA